MALQWLALAPGGLCSAWETWKQMWVTFPRRCSGNRLPCHAVRLPCHAVRLQGALLAGEPGRVDWPFQSVQDSRRRREGSRASMVCDTVAHGCHVAGLPSHLGRPSRPLTRPCCGAVAGRVAQGRRRQATDPREGGLLSKCRFRGPGSAKLP